MNENIAVNMFVFGIITTGAGGMVLGSAKQAYGRIFGALLMVGGATSAIIGLIGLAQS